MTVTNQDIQAFKTFLDDGGVLTIELFGETRIMKKVGAFYTLYAPNATMQSPMTVRNALEQLLLWRGQQVKRHEAMMAKSFVFVANMAKRSA